ncbi:MAG: hypothetical protein RLY50_141 [Actinomycetota bacterium]
MNDDRFRLLPEGVETFSIVDDPDFSEVSVDGEIYTRYRIVRFTHETIDHPDGWTHMANVVRVRRTAIGVARLRVVNRIIEDAVVALGPKTNQ